MKDKIDEVATVVKSLASSRQNEKEEKIKINTRTKIYLSIAALVGAVIIGAVLKAWIPVAITFLFGALL